MTLFEVLVVILILGILAGIGLAVFSGKDKIAMDAEAKTNARNLLTQVQTCYTEHEDYTLCDEESELSGRPPVVWGSGAGEVEILRGGDFTTKSKVTIRANSRALTNSQPHRFLIVKAGDEVVRTCESGGGGGCKDGFW